jgi:hypothetical protein
VLALSCPDLGKYTLFTIQENARQCDVYRYNISYPNMFCYLKGVVAIFILKTIKAYLCTTKIHVKFLSNCLKQVVQSYYITYFKL